MGWVIESYLFDTAEKASLTCMFEKVMIRLGHFIWRWWPLQGSSELQFRLKLLSGYYEVTLSKS